MTLYKPFEGNTKEEYEAYVPKREDFLICHNCGWSAEHQEHHAYISNVKVKCNSTRGIWFIGNKYVLKERKVLECGRRSYLGNDVSITNFLAKNSTIPVAKDMRYWLDDKSHYMMMERIPGETAESYFQKYNGRDAVTIAKEVVQYLVQLRKFTSTKLGAPDGSPIRNMSLGSQYRVQFLTDDVEEWWARTEPQLKERHRDIWKDFKERYPVKGPYVLTHGDLNAVNIMVKDGHVTGLLDWEHGGYLPESWEAMSTEMIENPNWHRVLVREMKAQLGPWPKEEIRFVDEYRVVFNEFESDQIEPWQNHPQSIKQCTNYARYFMETNTYPEGVILYRNQYRGEAAKQVAEALETFKALSSEEKEKAYMALFKPQTQAEWMESVAEFYRLKEQARKDKEETLAAFMALSLEEKEATALEAFKENEETLADFKAQSLEEKEATALATFKALSVEQRKKLLNMK